MKSRFEWISKRWEPLAAVLAILVSAISAYTSYVGIQLGREGIEIARQTSNEERQDNRLSRVPMIMPGFENNPPKLYLENTGLGSGFPYRLDIDYHGIRASINHLQNHREIQNSLMTMFRDIIADESVGKAPAGTRVDFFATIGNLFRLIGSNGRADFITINSESSELIKGYDWNRIFSQFNTFVCFTTIEGDESKNLYVQQNLETLFVPESCGAAPNPMSNYIP